jgi:hypothetical protein
MRTSPVDAASGVTAEAATAVAAVEDEGGAGADDATPGSGTMTDMMEEFKLIVARRDAAFALLLEQQKEDFEKLVEKHLSTINRRMDNLHSATNSNHGHITKRLFPALDEKIASLESSLAATTSELTAKGDSLLATVTALENKVATAIEKRLTSLESTVAMPQASATRTHQRKPPDDAPPAGATASSGRATVLGGATIEDDNTPAGGPIDVNACTRLAYEHARALNTPPRPPSAARPNVSPLPRTPATVRRSASPVRNPYYPSSQQWPSLRQTTIPETIGCDSGSGIPNPIGTATGFRGGDRSIPEGRDRSSGLPPPIDTAAGLRGEDRGDRPFVGGSVISPRKRDRDLRSRTLGASRFDVIKLACSEYHVGMDGVHTLTEDILAARGFAQALANVEDVVVCYKDIILAQKNHGALVQQLCSHIWPSG